MKAGWLPLDVPKTGWNWIRCHWASSSGLGSLLDVSEIVPFNPPGPWLCLIVLPLAFCFAASPFQARCGNGFCYPEQLSPTVFLLCEIMTELPFLENRTRFCLFLNISPSLPLGRFSQYSPLENLPSVSATVNVWRDSFMHGMLLNSCERSVNLGYSCRNQKY